MSTLFNPAVCAEIVALLAGLWLLRKEHTRAWRPFIYFLLFTVLIEVSGFALRIRSIRNIPLYSLLMLVQAGFFGWVFHSFLTGKKARVVLYGCLSLFLLLFIWQLATVPITTYYRNARLGLSAAVVICSSLFYLQLLRSDSIDSPLRFPPFWIITGLFFYYFGTASLFAFYEKVAQIRLSGNTGFFTLVTGGLSCVLYGSWIIGFIWKNRNPLSRPS